MSKKVLLFVWLSVMFVVLGFVLFGCQPKKPATKPEEAKTEGIVTEEGELIVGTRVEEKVAEKEKKKIAIAVSKEDVLIAADFDSGEKPNNLGGNFGAWNVDPADFTQGCFDSFVSTVKVGDKGYSIQLMYDVDSAKPAYNGFWMKLNGIDISGYSKLSFWVKGDEVRGFTRVFKVELKNKQKHMGKCYVTDTTNEWKNIVIPLDKFAGLIDLKSMDEFVIVFEDRIATKKEGAIYIDNIAFLK